jgi:putative ABC transport system ATP-binding protein
MNDTATMQRDPLGARGAVDDGADGRWLVEAVGLRRAYAAPGGDVHALRGVDLRVAPGELVAIRGRSGSGKTTLLNLLGGLDRPTDGWVAIDGQRLDALDDDALAGLRRGVVSYVFQSFGLLPILSAAENVSIPLRMASAEPSTRDQEVDRLLGLVGLAARARHRPAELSGGEQQRVAIARALASKPRLLLADEPSGQLDSATGRSIMALIRDTVRGEGVTAVVATHDPALIEVADRVHELRDGVIV